MKFRLKSFLEQFFDSGLRLFEFFPGVTNYDKECNMNFFSCLEFKMPNILIFANLDLNGA